MPPTTAAANPEIRRSEEWNGAEGCVCVCDAQSLNQIQSVRYDT